MYAGVLTAAPHSLLHPDGIAQYPQQNGTVVEESADSRLTTIVHPGINPKLVEKIKHAWFESKLVAD